MFIYILSAVTSSPQAGRLGREDGTETTGLQKKKKKPLKCIWQRALPGQHSGPTRCGWVSNLGIVYWAEGLLLSRACPVLTATLSQQTLHLYLSSFQAHGRQDIITMTQQSWSHLAIVLCFWWLGWPLWLPDCIAVCPAVRGSVDSILGVCSVLGVCSALGVSSVLGILNDLHQQKWGDWVARLEHSSQGSSPRDSSAAWIYE